MSKTLVHDDPVKHLTFEDSVVRLEISSALLLADLYNACQDFYNALDAERCRVIVDQFKAFRD